MEKSEPNKRLIVGFLLIAVLGIAWVANAIHIRALEHDLQGVVDKKSRNSSNGICIFRSKILLHVEF